MVSIRAIFAALLLILVVPVAAQDEPPLEVEYEIRFVPNAYALKVRSQSGFFYGEVVDFLSNGEPVQIIGPAELVNLEPWVPITYGQGETGWVEQYFVTGRVDRDEFCNDWRVLDVIEGLKEAVQNEDGEQLREVVSPRGLFIAQYSDARMLLTPEEVVTFFEDDRPRTWFHDGGSTWPRTESLAVEVTDKLQGDILAENSTLACNDNQFAMTITDQLYAVRPPGYEPRNFYSILRPGPPENELDWGAWGIVIEYWEDEPVIMALGYYVWTP